MRENSNEEVYQEVNNIHNGKQDMTHKNSQNQIDSVFVITLVIDCVNRYKLLEFHEIIKIDHKGFLFDLDAKRYFNTKYSFYNVKSKRSLNPNNRT